jgi:hypothetical protein
MRKRVLTQKPAPARAKPRAVQGEGEQLAAVEFREPGFANSGGLYQPAAGVVFVGGGFGGFAAVELRRRDAEFLG